MKRFGIGILITAVLIMISGMSYAADTKCSVNVEYVDLLQAPSSVTLIFSAASDSSGWIVDKGMTNNHTDKTRKAAATDILKYSHNSTKSKRIVATVIPDSKLAADITLKASLEGQPSVTLIKSGNPLSNVTVWDNVTAGGYTKKIDWNAKSNNKNVSGKTLSYTIQFTSSDIS